MTALAGSTSTSDGHGRARRRSATTTSDKRVIRRSMRARRRALAASERHAMDEAICHHIERLGIYRRARRVALFFDFDGEPSITRLPERAAARKKEFFAPVLSGGAIRFRGLEPSGDLRVNAYGIREPGGLAPVDVRSLDLVLTPLVAFDRHGTRLGMGAAYYDQCFAFLRRRTRWFRPKLIGVAYAFQEVATLPRDPWDVPLWGVVCETGFSALHES